MFTTMKKLILIISFLSNLALYGQQKTTNDNFTAKIQELEGDINHDGYPDKIVLSMDTVNTATPIKTEVFLSKPNGKLRLALSSTTMIEPRFPLPNFAIENGQLHILADITDGHANYKFRCRNGNLELIYLEKGTWDGKNTTTETQFNLLTGIKTEQVKALGSEENLQERKTKIKINPLPLLQELNQFDAPSFRLNKTPQPTQKNQ